MKKLILMVAFLASATSAFAEGLYVTADIGQAAAVDACAGVTGTGVTCDEKAIGFRFGGGFQFNRNLAVEASYGSLGSIKMNVNIPGVVSANAEGKMKAFQLAVVGSFPVADNFSLLGKLGMARASLDSSGSMTILGVTTTIPPDTITSTKLAWGLGAQFDMTKQIALRAQYERLGGASDNPQSYANLSLISAGLVMKF